MHCGRTGHFVLVSLEISALDEKARNIQLPNALYVSNWEGTSTLPDAESLANCEERKESEMVPIGFTLCFPQLVAAYTVRCRLELINLLHEDVIRNNCIPAPTKVTRVRPTSYLPF